MGKYISFMSENQAHDNLNVINNNIIIEYEKYSHNFRLVHCFFLECVSELITTFSIVTSSF